MNSVKTLKIAIYSACFGQYDLQKKFHKQQSLPCDFYIFNDKNEDSFVNNTHIITDKLTDPNWPPTMRSIYYRCFPFKIPQLNEYDILIYLDGNIEIHNSEFIKHLFTAYSCIEYPLTITNHPYRNTIHEERNASTHPKYNGINLQQQIDEYYKEGYKDELGLFWNGLLIYNRRLSTAQIDELKKFQELWHNEFWKYHNPGHPIPYPQGQISLPFILWKTKLSHLKLPSYYLTLLGNNYVRVHGH